MKIIKRSLMPDGTDIQIEDWRNDYPTVFKTISIAAYPKAKYGSRSGFIQRGKSFRLSMDINWSSNNEVLAIFKCLENGEILLEDLGEHYWNGDKDKFYMGFESVSEEPIY